MLCSQNFEMNDPRVGECILVPCGILHDIFVITCDFCRRVYSTSIFTLPDNKSYKNDAFSQNIGVYADFCPPFFS